METKTVINKDLILREKLAVQRTIMANQTTLLSFLRTSLYFFIAALTLHNLFTMAQTKFLEISFYVISIVLLLAGIINFYIQFKKIEESKKHIGDFKMEYLNKQKND